MLSILKNNYEKFKCGEIYCLTSSKYKVHCCLCGEQIEFDIFPDHFEVHHLATQEHSPIGGSVSSNEIVFIRNSNKIVVENLKTETAIEHEQHDHEQIDAVKIEGNCNSIEFIDERSQADSLEQDEIAVDIKDLDALANIINSDCDIKRKENIETAAEHVPAETNQNNKGSGINRWIEANNHESSSDEDKSQDKAKKKHEFVCNKCNRSYKLKRSLLNHIRINHNPNSVKKKTKVKKFECKECGEKFHTERLLNGHMWKHTGIKCDICGRSFTQTGNLMRHKIRHTGVKAHKCTQCDYSFFTEKELRSHQITHSGILPVICEVCGKRVRDQGVLTAHMRRHTGERPAKCGVCGKSFFSFYDLNIHAVAHTDLRPFVCDICGSTFQRKKCLRIHKKLHSDSERKHICQICGKAFTQSGGLKTHLRTHKASSLINNTENHVEIRITTSIPLEAMKTFENKTEVTTSVTEIDNEKETT